MKAYTTTKYPIFEADQVLSQKHLNTIVSYLEEQDRITRKGLIGIGIVCGFDISFPQPNQIKIACGKAVTSLGFQIEMDEKTFSFYHNIELSNTFLAPDTKNEAFLDPIFVHSKKYAPIKKTVELLESNTTELDKIAIPNNFFDNKIVLLLLETALIDEKNCVSTNCDDKGKRFEFNIRPLLINQTELNSLKFPSFQDPETFHSLFLPRYGVPFTKLLTGQNVLDSFKKIFDDALLTNMSQQIGVVYNYYKGIIDKDSQFSLLLQPKQKLLSVINTNKESLNVQYLWDWLYDIVYAINEIIDFKNQNPTLCCVDENVFPLHVVLGNPKVITDFRTPFLKTGNSDAEKIEIQKLRLLFERLVLLINSWSIDDDTIKITPSVYGAIPLSDKSIPFYYENILELNKKWNPEKTVQNRNNEILSYYSDIANYTTITAVKEPLLYDVEPYNFFRIEGHIGQNYQTALTQLTALKETYNLPFKVIALNAVDFVGKEVDISKHQGSWGDLELDYDMAKKKVYNITEFVINWINQNKEPIISKNLLSAQTITTLKTILSQVKLLLKEDLQEFLPGYKNFYEIFKNLNIMFLFHRFCLTLNKETISALAEDLVDHLDEINELFLEDPFTVIFEEAQSRWENIYKELFLSTFLQKNKGLEHKAGVPKGGTFVLIYTDNSIFTVKEVPFQEIAFLNTIKKYNDDIDFGQNSAQIKADIIEGAVLKKSKFEPILPYDDKALKDCKEQTNLIKSNLIKMADYNMDKKFPSYMIDFLKGNLESLLQFEPIDTNESAIPQKVILADFYLPYIYSPEGDTINIVLAKEQPPKEPGDFNGEDFNT
jgi:hypothetical protein